MEIGRILKVLSFGVAIISVILYYILNYYLKPKYGIITKGLNDLLPQYEYIIIGGGTSGVILASRLSEDPDKFVLVLESGRQLPLLSHFPYFKENINSPNFYYEWNVSSPFDATKIEVWRYGHVLGGSSVFGESIYELPSAKQWNHWALERNVSDLWGWENVEPKFRLHPNSPLTVVSSEGSLLNNAVKEAISKEDFRSTGLRNPVFSETKFMEDEYGQKRTILSTYFNQEVQSRFNLHIVTGATATKINFNMDGKATGVDYLYEGKMQRVLINREVIISAGVISTPNLLLRSGIGPEKELNKLKVVPVHLLPSVGKHLSGQLSVSIHYESDKLCSANEAIPEGLNVVIQKLCRLLVSYGGFGLLCDSNKSAGVSLYLYPQSNGSEEADLRVVLMPSEFQENEKTCRYEARITLLNVFSRGSVSLDSLDLDSPPKIEVYPDESNIALLSRAALRFHEFLQLPSFSKLRFKLVTNDKCSSNLKGDQYFACLIRNSLKIGFSSHTSTCSIGTDPTNSVVDINLRVHGVQGVRIADSSVLPSMACAYGPLASVIMIAEKAAEMVISSY